MWIFLIKNNIKKTYMLFEHIEVIYPIELKRKPCRSGWERMDFRMSESKLTTRWFSTNIVGPIVYFI